MDNQNNPQQLFNFRFSESVKFSLRALAITAGTAAVLAIVKVIFSLVNAFMQMGKIKTAYDFNGNSSATKTMMAGGVAGAVIMLVINIFLFYYLNRFSRSVKTGLDTNNQEHVAQGISGLSVYFKIIGVLLIIFIALMFLFILLAIAAGGRQG